MDNNWRVQQSAELVEAEVVTEGGRMCDMAVRNRQGGDACKADLLGGDEDQECRDGGIGRVGEECAVVLEGSENSIWKRHRAAGYGWL